MNAPDDRLLVELLRDANIQALVSLDEPSFNRAMERLRRAHLEGQGYRFQDEDHPSACPTCEG